LSKCNRKFMRARSVDFVESSWINGFDVWSMKCCAVKLSAYGRRSTIAERFGLKKLPTLISRTRSFDKSVLGTPRPDSTSILSENPFIIPTTHHQCRTLSSSSAVPSQARSAAKQ
jgi:hypothetical protein